MERALPRSESLSRANVIVFLIRHGETDYNLARISQGGGLDAPLNEKGIDQAIDSGEEIKDKLLNTTKIQVYSSELQRALTTAQIIGTEIKNSLGLEEAPPIREFPELNERYFGNLVGKDEVTRGKMLSSRGETMENSTIPGLEPDEEFRERVIGAFEKIIEESQEGSRMLIVCHGGVLDKIIEYLKPGSGRSKGNDLGYAYKNGELIPHDVTQLRVDLLKRKIAKKGL